MRFATARWALLALLCVSPTRSSQPIEIVVYAAASLRDALTEIGPKCEAAAGAKLVFNFGGSNDLARQIVAANKADVFVSADEGWMDRVAEAGLVEAATRRKLLSNRLVIVASGDFTAKVGSAADLAALPTKWISLANPDAVPAGKYARAWLTKAGVWERVRDRVLPAPDVRAALAAVEHGAAEVGVVYRTDVALSTKVRVLHEVSEAESGVRIVYPVTALSDRPHLPQARRVVECLGGSDARAIFEKGGFLAADPP